MGVWVAVGGREERDGGGEAQHCRQIPGWWWGAGLAASTAVCTAVLAPMFRLPPWQPPVAVLVAGLVGAFLLPPPPHLLSLPLCLAQTLLAACSQRDERSKDALSIATPPAVLNPS